MMKILFIWILLIGISLNLYAQTPQELFVKANESFKNENYQDASKIYEDLISKGFENFEIYYNLGNTYFRLANYSAAILNYERAKKIEPGNEDVAFNLRIANLKIVDKFDTLPKLFFVQWYEFLLNLFSSCIWAKIIIVCFWMFLISILLFRISKSSQLRKIMFFYGNSVLVVLIISVIMSINTYKKETSKNEAIVFNTSVYVKSAPENNSTDMFVLHEGTKIKLLDNVGDWFEIKVENGNVGWVPKNAIVII